jgi:hypothetical protein
MNSFIYNTACIALSLPVAYLLVNDAIIDYHNATKQMKDALNSPIPSAPSASPEKNRLTEDQIHSLHGIFGEVPEQKQATPSKLHIPIVQYGPKTLEGVFIQDANKSAQAWALVTNQDGEFLIIPPSQILSFTNSSISIKTQQGLKSLHLKKDEQGIDIRKVRKAAASQSQDTKKPELSRAEMLRRKMLSK